MYTDLNTLSLHDALPIGMSGFGVLLFAAFTAYKTQEVTNIYSQVRGIADLMKRTTIYGALHLYIAFINMFLFLLRFMGSRERSEEPTSALQSLMRFSSAVFCLKKKKPDNHYLQI